MTPEEEAAQRQTDFLKDRENIYCTLCNTIIGMYKGSMKEVTDIMCNHCLDLLLYYKHNPS